VLEPLLVSLQSFSEGKEKVSKRGRHGVLVMRVTRHDGSTVFPCSLEKSFDQLDHAIAELQDLIPEIQAHVQGNLVIAASSRVELSSGFDTYSADEKTLDIGVNILFRGIEFELSRSIKRIDLSQSLQNFLPIPRGDNSPFTEHHGMGTAPPQVIGNQSLIACRHSPHISPGEEIDDLLRG